MKKIAFATDRESPNIFDSNELLVPLLAQHGYLCLPAVWDDPAVDWSQFCGVLIRSTWDYWKNVETFLSWIKQLEAAGLWVFHSSQIVAWNLEKTYLRELEKKGITLLPTQWAHIQETDDIWQVAARVGSDRVVIKPTFSCNAHRTLVLSVPERKPLPQFAQEDLSSLMNTSVMLQPFFPEVMEEGEWSLLYYGGKFSHGFIKRPLAGEFRVQERFGGQNLSQAIPPGAGEFADQVINCLSFDTLYARVDMLRRGSEFYLMELEMIEPSLYFNLDERAPQRFVDALLRRIPRP